MRSIFKITLWPGLPAALFKCSFHFKSESVTFSQPVSTACLLELKGKPAQSCAIIYCRGLTLIFDDDGNPVHRDLGGGV